MASIFTFDAYEWQPETGQLALRYGYDTGEKFEERLTFTPPYRALNAQDHAVLDRAFRFLFLLAGVSYYKAKIPPQLECRAFELDHVTATLLKKIYYNGLGEFAYRNHLDLRERLNFISTRETPEQGVILDLPQHLLIPVGGGKDSVVTIEAMKKTGLPIHLFALGAPSGTAQPIQECIDCSHLSAIKVARTIAPTLIELNKAGAYNGHIPITAILSAITVVCAILYGFDTIILSNEHSASAPNLRLHDLEVNHQYSKSFVFEQDFASYVRDVISPSINYFSLLRPLSEIAIVQRFATHTTYHDVFRSCNTAFKQDVAARGKKWCCDCPKCRFVFLSLTPFLPKEKLVSIFGRNLLDDPDQTLGFAELCGLSAYKPFECVGEIDESLVLMVLAAHHADWQQDHVVQELRPQLHHSLHWAKDKFDQMLLPQRPHAVPHDYLKWVTDV